MVVARRTVSIFLAVWGVSHLLFGCHVVVSFYLFGPHSSCVVPPPTLETWVLACVVLLLAAVLWAAPWRRFVGGWVRGRRLVPFRLKRRLVQAGGYALVGFGVGTIVASVWGILLRSGESACFVEIGCYHPSPVPGLGAEPIREPLVSMVRFVGVAFGLAALLWGSREAGLNRRRFVRRLVLAAAVFLVLLVLLAPGHPGVGTVQASAVVIAVLAAIVLFRVRDVLADTGSKLLASPYAAPVAMAATVVLGAWLAVLVTVSPVGCRGPVRCAQELRPAMLLAVAAAAAGMYLAYIRWTHARMVRVDQRV